MKFFRSALTRQHVPIAVDFGVCVVFWGGCAECTECVCVCLRMCVRERVYVCVCVSATDRQTARHTQTDSQSDRHSHTLAHNTHACTPPCLCFPFSCFHSAFLFAEHAGPHQKTRSREDFRHSRQQRGLNGSHQSQSVPCDMCRGGIAVPCLF